MKKPIYFYELIFMFLLGSLIYSLLEILFRGYTHWTMTILGGVTGAALYVISSGKTPIFIQCLYGSFIITAFELIVGIFVNIILHWDVWDYSDVPFNLLGQICLPFSVVWYVISLPALLLCRFVRETFSCSIIPHNTADSNRYEL
ncbi:MAG: hypothetical protein J6B17_00330 [Ruminococcus sp.]|nr:hypothetical protein [Ruminococcus sp.]